MTFDNIIRPTNIESKATHLKEGFIMGWIPGIITSLEDPEKLGRVRCKCDLIDSSANLPNEESYIWVGEEFTLNSIPGGSQSPLQVGTQVALMAMMGNPSQLLLIKCLNSRVDRPHPLFSRTDSTYGTVTLNEVFDIKNDAEQSRIEAYPHGVTKSVTATGDDVVQTKGGASQVLKQDGTVLTQNPKAGMALNKEGEIIHSVASGAKTEINKEGKITLENAFGGKLLLLDSQSKMTGPPSTLSGLMGKFGGLRGLFGKALSAISPLKSIGIGLDPSNILSSLTEGGNILNSLSSTVGAMVALRTAAGIAKGDVVGALSKLPVSEFIYATQPQLALAMQLGLPDIANKFTQVVTGKASIQEIVNTIATTALERNLPIKLDEVTGIVTNLRKQPERLVEAATSLFVPGGFSEIENLAGMGILRTIPQIEATLGAIATTWEDDLPLLNEENLIKQLQLQFPQELQNFITGPVIKQAIDYEDPVSYLLSQVQVGLVKGVEEMMNQLQPTLEQVSPISTAINGLVQENYHQVFNAVSLLEPEFGEIVLGDTSINQWGNIDVGEVDLGTVLGDYNPGAVDLTSLDARTILEDLLDQEIDLSQFGIPVTINLQSLLSGIDLGEINLPALVTSPIDDLLDFAQIKLSSLFDQTALADVKNLDIAGINLSQLLPNTVLPEVSLQKVIASVTNQISLSEVFPNAKDTTSIADVINNQELGEYALAKVQLPKLIGNDLAELDLSQVNLGVTPGAVEAEQLVEFANKAFAPITQKLDNLLQDGLQALNKAGNSIPKRGEGSKVELGQVAGQLISQYGRHRVFADHRGAGISTPWGRFSLGSGGGGMFALGSMAMGVLEKFNSAKATGVFLSPEHGIALAETDKRDNPNDWSFDDAKVQVYKGGVRIQAAGGLHHILVLPTGVFINGYNIGDWWNRYDVFIGRLQAIEAFIESLQQ